MTEAYPLSWPPGWPRRKKTQDSDRIFKGPTYHWDRVYRALQDELRRIGAADIVVSTNQPLRNDGAPYAQQRNIPDVGVAVYFKRNKKQLVMAQDRFDTIVGNMRSLTLAISGLRQMERHGGAVMLERAFDGFLALPPIDSYWQILGLNGPRSSRETIMSTFRSKVKAQHGTGADMDRLVKARDEALENIA